MFGLNPKAKNFKEGRRFLLFSKTIKLALGKMSSFRGNYIGTKFLCSNFLKAKKEII